MRHYSVFVNPNLMYQLMFNTFSAAEYPKNRVGKTTSQRTRKHSRPYVQNVHHVPVDGRIAGIRLHALYKIIYCPRFSGMYVVFFSVLYIHTASFYWVLSSVAGIAGDITPYCGVSDKEKKAKESAALDVLGETLGECCARDQIRKLWEEYEAGETAEAKLVKDFDKVRVSCYNQKIFCPFTCGCLA